MSFEPGEIIQPIQYPLRPSRISIGGAGLPHKSPAPNKFVDRRREGLRHVRFDFRAEVNPLKDRSDYEIVSPEDFNITIDSANDQSQVYYLPSYHPRGSQLLRPIVDRVNNIYITYHYDRMSQKWVKMITRLRKDLQFPSPPVTYTRDHVPYYGSRGTRYVRYKRDIAGKHERRQSLWNRLFYGNKSGTSGVRYTLGPFATGSR